MWSSDRARSLALALALAAASSCAPREETVAVEAPPPLPSALPPSSAPPPAVPPPAQTLAGGLLVEELRHGGGAEARKGRTLTVHYVGTLASTGKEFDSSRKRGQPFVFILGQGMVIKGWDAGLDGMREGDVRRLTIPPELGYGDRGHPPTIPPQSTLVFEIELLEVK